MSIWDIGMVTKTSNIGLENLDSFKEYDIGSPIQTRDIYNALTHREPFQKNYILMKSKEGV